MTKTGPLFQKRHYQFFTKRIRAIKNKEELVGLLCIWFKSDNDIFDEERFRKAVYDE